MNWYPMVAVAAVVLLGACTPPHVTSRMDTNDTFYSGFDSRESYTPEVVGARANNDFMRFSTMSMAR